MKKVLAVAVLFLSSSILYGDISVTDRSSTLRFLSDPSALRQGPETANPADKAARLAANQAKKDAKKAKHHGLTPVTQSLHPRAEATGSIGLIDAAGLKYLINTDITFPTSSSASGAASQASYQAVIATTTVAGGAGPGSALNNMFNGYNALCVSLTNATGPCATGNAAYAIYNNNGPTPFDASVPPGPACTNRQLAFPAQTIGGLSVKRKVFVPTNDRFIRWMNFFTNTTGSPITFTMITSNNLGSKSNTKIISSSNGDNVAQTTDNWITSFQNFVSPSTTSSEPRIGHVIQGPGAPTPVSNIFFVDGNGFPYWVYSITLAPGQTKAILNFATGQGTKAAANAQAVALDLLPANATQCLSGTELSQIVNFVVSADLSIVKNTAASVAFGSNPITYTLAVTNNGPSTANTVSVSDTLPAGSTFVSASGTGWVCNNVAGVVTCTVASLPLGAAPVISLTFNAPPVVTAGTLSNTATVSSATTDPTPANNSSTSTVPIFPGNQIPALSTWMLGLLAAALGFVALARRT